ncbi:hypothetical protein ACFFMN_09280 [Planobispora siamensis]|uniref:Uncharacterized protein n=1 Tax=Planobispora siamensis TaxID=936338 RepID=A0A8J3SEK5_9ACTN|nr:hypothetical protein [Planobispora siamensis]GIH91176.1 hypothetical protein Psi01_18060 [Planobispora siamensis]
MSEHKPYTYVTTSIDKDTTRLGIDFYTADLWVSVLDIGGKRPALTVSSREARVLVSSTGGGPITDQDLRIAREIADAAARYLADCERLHAAQTVIPGSTDEAAA